MDVWRLIPAPNPNEIKMAKGFQVLWPKDSAEEQAWRFAPSLLKDAPQTLRERIRSARGSGCLLRYNVSGRTQPLILRDFGDNNGPDNPRALQSLIVKLEVLRCDVAKWGGVMR